MNELYCQRHSATISIAEYCLIPFYFKEFSTNFLIMSLLQANFIVLRIFSHNLKRLKLYGSNFHFQNWGISLKSLHCVIQAYIVFGIDKNFTKPFSQLFFFIFSPKGKTFDCTPNLCYIKGNVFGDWYQMEAFSLYLQHLFMIRVPVKKPNLLLKKARKSPLKLDSRLPNTCKLTIVRLTPLKQQQNSPAFQPKPQLKTLIRRSVPVPTDQNALEKNDRRSYSCPFQKKLSSTEFVKKIENFIGKQEQQQIQAKNQDKYDDQKSTQNAQPVEKLTKSPENQCIQHEDNFSQKNKPAEMKQREKRNGRLSLPCLSRPRTQLLAIYKVLSETIFLEKTESKASQSAAAEASSSLKDGQSAVSCKPEQNSTILTRREEKDGGLACRQIQIKEMETRLSELKQEVEIYEQQRLKYGQELLRRQTEMKEFLAVQPNKILRLQAQGYKESEQTLFDIASNLEVCSYENMVSLLSSEIEVPEGSFFYAIDSFETESDQTTVTAFKKKLKSIYENILGKVKEIIKRKCNKIQQFVQIMRNLASYTIGKREYLNGINNKVVRLVAHSAYLFAELESQRSNEGINTLKQIVEDFQQAYTEAQIFY